MAVKKTGGAKKSIKATSAGAKKNTAKKPVRKVSSKTKKQNEKLKNMKKSIATQNKETKKTTQKKAEEKLSDVYTSTGVRLTIREAKFIDEYVQTGNGRQAAINAGYTGLPSPVANKLLKKDYIAAEIQNRMSLHEKNSIADRQEIMQFWTDMMRGKILDQFEMPTTNSDKLKAAAELAKRGIDIEDRIKEKKEIGAAPEIKISLKWDEEQAT